MADQEFLASYAVDIDEEGVERLQSVLEENRSLAESLSSAFQQAYQDLSTFVRQVRGLLLFVCFFRLRGPSGNDLRSPASLPAPPAFLRQICSVIKTEGRSSALRFLSHYLQS